MEVPKFKEDILISIITVKKLRDLLLTLLQVKAMHINLHAYV